MAPVNAGVIAKNEIAETSRLLRLAEVLGHGIAGAQAPKHSTKKGSSRGEGAGEAPSGADPLTDRMSAIEAHPLAPFFNIPSV